MTDKLPALPPRPTIHWNRDFPEESRFLIEHMNAQDARIEELERESEESLEFRQKEQDQWNALRDQHKLEIVKLEREIQEALSIMNGESILSPVWCKQVHEWTKRNAEKGQREE